MRLLFPFLLPIVPIKVGVVTIGLTYHLLTAPHRVLKTFTLQEQNTINGGFLLEYRRPWCYISYQEASIKLAYASWGGVEVY